MVYGCYPPSIPLCSPSRLEDRVLRKFDPVSLRTISGYRDGQAIVTSVPNLAHFQTTLRAVKFWAKRNHSLLLILCLPKLSHSPTLYSIGRNIYSNSFGFLGGFSWAVLVAWICKNSAIYKQSSPSSQYQWPEEQLLAEFFETYNTWEWNKPVALNSVSARFRINSQVRIPHMYITLL